jgi:tetratricopeptide (TPR) repeat protein
MLTDLGTTPLADVLLRLAREQSSGDLQVHSGKVVKTLFFDHGRIIFAASNLKKDRLGEALVAIGRITAEEFDRASALMKDGSRKRRFGEALVQAGVMDKNELGGSVARQVKQIVISLFELAEGSASFEERPCPIPLDYMVSLSVNRLLYVGIRAMKSQALVMAGLGDLDRRVTLAAVPPFRFGVKKCSAEELEILEHAKRSVTLRRLAWAPGGISFHRLRLTYSLLASGILQEAAAQAAAAPPPVVQMETSTFLLSALRKRPDPSARDALRQEVAGELERSANLDRETWLKVSRSAPRDELARALEEKMERYHALLEAVGDDDALRTDIELILGRASSMLRLARQPVPGTTAETAAPATPSNDAAPPAGPSTPGPSTTEGALVPESPARESRPRPAAPPARPPAPPTPAVHEPVTPGTFTGNALIEHLLMEGEVRMTVSDYANAVKVYARLVEAAPETASFRTKLAIAMACFPPTAKQAEREFFEAVRLDPQNADIHYQLALYYKAMRVKSRAITELQTAVRLKPQHKAAREELAVLSPKDSALTSLKKLFK